MKFARYLVLRIAAMIAVLLVVSLVTYLIFEIVPANPARAECGRLCTPAQLHQVRAFMGLNHSVWRQYLDFLGGLAVTALGHAHPAVAEAIADQARTLLHVSNLYYNAVQPQVAARLDALHGGGGKIRLVFVK